MIKRLIRNIRQKPKSTRDAIALGGSAVFSLLILTIWIYNTPSRMAAIESSYETGGESEGSSFGSLFSGIKDQFASAIDSIDLATSTDEAEMEEDVQVREFNRDLVMPNIQNDIEVTGAASSTSSVDETESDNSPVKSDPSPREVRIITTQSTSSASSTTP